MNIYLGLILAILIGNYLLRLRVELLNVSFARPQLPEEFKGWYDPRRYQKSQTYLKEKTQFYLISSGATTLIFLVFILGGGFNFVDRLARSFGLESAFTGLIFAGFLFFGLQAITIPFSVYNTFVLEQKYGFNKTTPKTFIADILKSWLLILFFLGLLFWGIVVLFESGGRWAWYWCWAAVILGHLISIFIIPLIVLPLFNKFTPLEDGELKEAVAAYARAQKFKLKGIFKIDGSRRSTKSNAYFTGFGKSRRIALFDTLIQNHSQEEIVSILAHEIGHYKKKHLLKRLGVSVLTKGLLFFLLSLFINNPGLFRAFKMENVSVYASIVFFLFLYTPVSFILSIAGNIVSRKHEYEADRFAALTYPHREAFISALKRLTVNNLSNLTPHPLKVFLDYSHPPILTRIAVLKALNRGKEG